MPNKGELEVKQQTAREYLFAEMRIGILEELRSFVDQRLEKERLRKRNAELEMKQIELEEKKAREEQLQPPNSSGDDSQAQIGV